MNNSIKSQLAIFERYSDKAIKYFSIFALFASVLGAIIQFSVLVTMGKGIWILSYFSTTSIIIDGITYILYLGGLIIYSCALYGITFLLWSLENKWKKLIIIVFFVFNLIFYYLLLKVIYLIYLAPYFMLSLVMLTSLSKENIFKCTEDDKQAWGILIFGTLAFTVLIAIVPNKYEIKYISNFPVIKNELSSTDTVTKIYFNDQFVFVQFRDENSTNRLIIKKVESLFDAREKTINLD